MSDRDRQTVTTEQRLRAELRRGDRGAGEALAPREADAIRRAMLTAAAEAAAAEAATAGRRRRAWPARTVLAATVATVAAVLCLMAILIGRQLPRPGTGGTPRALRAPPAPAAAALPPRGDGVAATRGPLNAGAGPTPVATPGHLARGPGHGPGRGGAGRLTEPSGKGGGVTGNAFETLTTATEMSAPASEALAGTGEGPQSGEVSRKARIPEASAAASAETPRQVQFSTKGGTRVIWVMRPESSR
jgi:hypothetical protein